MPLDWRQATTRSGRPSRFRSPMATERGSRPVAKSAFVPMSRASRASAGQAQDDASRTQAPRSAARAGTRGDRRAHADEDVTSGRMTHPPGGTAGSAGEGGSAVAGDRLGDLFRDDAELALQPLDQHEPALQVALELGAVGVTHHALAVAERGVEGLKQVVPFLVRQVEIHGLEPPFSNAGSLGPFAGALKRKPAAPARRSGPGRRVGPGFRAGPAWSWRPTPRAPGRRRRAP